MKILLFSLLLTTALPAPTVSSAINQTYIKCFVNHWRGTDSTKIQNSDESVSLDCGTFWKAEREKGTPFILLVPGLDPQPIPYPYWSEALKDLLKISKEPK